MAEFHERKLQDIKSKYILKEIFLYLNPKQKNL